MKIALVIRLFLAVVLLLCCSVVAASSWRDGERLYHEGILPDGTNMIARVMGGAALTGQFAACVRCHRPSGHGGSEGNLQVPAIAGSILFRPLEPRRDRLFRQLYQERQGVLARMHAQIPRTRRAYIGAADLGQALNHGLDPEGQPLAASMPRYTLTSDAQQSLTLYLQRLGQVDDPGVDQHELHLATVLGPGVSSRRAKAMLDVMQAFIDLHNREMDRELSRPDFSPGYKALYGPSRRYWRLHVWTLQGPVEHWSQQLASYYQDIPVFAMLGGQVDSAWAPVDQFCESMNLPCLFPLTQWPDNSNGHFTRYLSTGWPGEVELAVRHLADSGLRQVSIIRDDTQDSIKLAGLFEKSAGFKKPGVKIAGWTVVAGTSAADRASGIESTCWPPDDAELPLQTDAVVLLVSTANTKFALQCIEASGYTGSILLVVSRIADGRGHPALMPVRPVLVTWQTAVPGFEPRRLYRLRRWLQARRIADIDHEQLQLNTYLTLDATRHAMTHLLDRFSREYFLETIEHEMENALNPGTFMRLSLGPEQRYAARGGQVMQLLPDGTLRRLEP